MHHQRRIDAVEHARFYKAFFDVAFRPAWTGHAALFRRRAQHHHTTAGHPDQVMAAGVADADQRVIFLEKGYRRALFITLLHREKSGLVTGNVARHRKALCRQQPG